MYEPETGNSPNTQSFQDLMIARTDNKLVFNIYRNPTIADTIINYV
jgi:hypothetical protein